MSKLKEWLESLPNTKDVHACKVTIGKDTFEGAFYTQVLEYTSGMDCVRNGRHKVGDKYEQDALYCIGKAVLKEYCCYPYEGKEWYIACYADPKRPIAPEHQQHHPFGYNFVMMPWTAKDKIDKYEKTYKRIPMTIDT